VLLSRVRKGGGNTVLIASALPQEGKTFTALNLAAAFAIEGRRTLFIEADLRSPSVAAQLFGKEQVSGVVDVLTGQAGLEEAVRASKVENLSILAAGSSTDKPSEVLGSDQMSELLAKAAASWEHVIIDSAPIIEASDTLRIARLANVVCLVARCGKTPGRAVARAIHLLISAESGTPEGLVLNDCADDVA
jgi:capsular exopolysaccharide synthesis family protein